MKKELLLFISSNYPEFRINKNLLNNEYNLFDEIKLLNENDLDQNIFNTIKEIKSKYGERGYGYWIWKPYLILQELNNLQEGDILVFLNSHCKLDIIKDRFLDILNYLNNSEIPLIIGKVGFNDYMYTTTKLKNVIENYLNYNFSEEEMLLPQYEAGILFMKKSKFVKNFFKQYFDIMKNNIDVITDFYNDDIDNHQTFIENRHDQSVCSLLAKYYKITNLNIYWSDLN